MIPGCLPLAYEGMRCIADASRCSASEGARGPNIVAASAHRGLRVRQSKGGQREEGDGGGGGGRRKRVEIGKGLEEKKGGGRHRLRHPGITQNCLAARVELTA